jgi:glycosyltransferase involved in cell wall biosynthesis
MKVLLLSTYELKGGAAIACKRLMTALNKQEGVEAKMLVMQKQSEDVEVIQARDSIFDKFNMAYERLSFLPYEKDKSVRFQFSIANTGQDITKHELYQWCDVVNMHWVNQGFVGLKGIAKLMGGPKPLVWTLHDMWAFTGGEHYSGESRALEEKAGFSPMLNKPSKKDLSHRLWKKKKAAYQKLHIATCSSWLKEEALSSSLMRDADVRNIPNPIDLNQYKVQNKAELRAKLKITSEKKLVLFGAFNLEDERKGMSFLLKALEELPSKEEVALVLFGKGEVPELGMEQHKLGIVPSDQMAEVYGACDVFVSPSIQDNLPNTIMEAMACGTPCLAFDVGGIPEMIDHKENGYLAKYKNADDLRKGLEYVLAHPELAEKTRSKVESYFTEDKVANRYLDFYRDVQSKW